MQLVRLIWLSSATIIVLLHSMIAHSHHAELSPEQHIKQHQEADNLIDYILLGFHNDQGAGHLEDMTFGDSLEINHSDFISLVSILATHFYLIVFDVDQEFELDGSSELPDSDPPAYLLLRGPPTQS